MFKTPLYHVIPKGKSFEILRNNDGSQGLFQFRVKGNQEFQKQTDRPPIASDKYPPNAARFLKINKNPDILSATRRVPQTDFTK